MMNRYEDVGTIGNFIPMAIRRDYEDFWHKQLELGFWAKLGLWLRGKL